MIKIKRNIDGFTLIEVAVVIAIVGIVSAIAIGGYLSWKPGNVFRSAVSQIQNDLNRAKMRAVETRRQCRVVFNTNGYQIEDGNRVMNSNAWGNVDANGTHTAGVPFRTEDFAELPEIFLRDGGGAVIDPLVPATVPTIIFSPRGTATLNSLDVVHPNVGTADIAVNITGRINIDWP